MTPPTLRSLLGTHSAAREGASCPPRKDRNVRSEAGGRPWRRATPLALQRLSESRGRRPARLAAPARVLAARRPRGSAAPSQHRILYGRRRRPDGLASADDPGDRRLLRSMRAAGTPPPAVQASARGAEGGAQHRPVRDGPVRFVGHGDANVLANTSHRPHRSHQPGGRRRGQRGDPGAINRHPGRGGARHRQRVQRDDAAPRCGAPCGRAIRSSTPSWRRGSRSTPRWAPKTRRR